MKLNYWKAKRLDDADCYSIRTKTRKEGLEAIEWCKENWSDTPSPSGVDFSKPYKVEIEYDSGFDLMRRSQEEGGLYEDANWDIEGTYALTNPGDDNA